MGYYKGFSNLNGQSRMHIHDVTNLAGAALSLMGRQVSKQILTAK